LARTTAEIIPGYTIRERIGAGGYGEVWKADAPGGLVKAVKFVYGCLDGERATRELKALSRIKEVRHPFLLSLERIEVIDGQLVIVTELADASLMNRFEQCVAAGGPGIPREELLVYMSDAADALDFMRQSFSLQHLDIKPENLLILSGRVKVADFGLVKDVQDTTVSLVGGLTPVYAAPEVFAGRPSLHSDQYSLAIVYQELLTGVLPYSGRNHAQLVTQHQRSIPRLAPLPPDDRPVIARALAKDPEERFPSCRELVDRLRNGGGPGKPGRADFPAPAAKELRGDTSATKVVDTVPHEQQKHKRRKPQKADDPAVPFGPTVSFEGNVLPPGSLIEHLTSDLPQPRRKPGPSIPDDWPLTFGGPAEAAKDLPPTTMGTWCPTDSAAWRMRPCLVLGLGGTAGLVLKGLRRRWSDRRPRPGVPGARDGAGDLGAVPVLQMLLVDSDRRSLAEAVGEDPSRGLKPAETIAMPLGEPEEYFAASEKHLKWLRRRWLCRIPRSHCPEGLRPLGRLALIDHFPELIGHLKSAISTMTSAEAIAAAAGGHVGQEIDAAPPQIVLVASISGGTGSGMVLDAAYAVRKVLADLSLADARLTGVLLHSTGRDPHGKLLARANACACLRELHYFGQSGFPGDANSGLPALAAKVRPFDTTRIVHLGDGPDPKAFCQAAENVGQFLDLATATAAGALFDAVHEPEAAEMTVRTCGLCRIGRTEEERGPALLKSCLESAAPRLGTCGGSRRLWLTGSCDALSDSLRAAIEREAGQRPSVVLDSHSDCACGWEIEGMSLPRIAASLIDNQRDAAQLASLLHTRLDIEW
jgi:serine/threonine protein kinase